MALSTPLYASVLVLSTLALNSGCEESCRTAELLGEKLGSVGTRIEMLEEVIQKLKSEFVQMKNLSEKIGEQKIPPNPSCPSCPNVTCPSCPDVVCATCPAGLEPTSLTPVKKNKKFLPKDCTDILQLGRTCSGVYTIYLNGSSSSSIRVFCNMETDGGGWTVFQRRGDFGEPRQRFDSNWTDYKYGFGELIKEFWLGNDAIHVLTNQEPMILRVDLEDWEGRRRYTKYQKFLVASECYNYNLTLSDHSGNVEDSLHEYRTPFSTRDRDNDRYVGVNCAEKFKGGWWYNDCGYVKLNSVYYNETMDTDDGIDWNSSLRFLTFTEMKVRPKRPYSDP